MHRSSKLWTVGLLLVMCLAGLVLPVQAQTGSPHAQSIEVDLWPEYDRPAMLAIINLQLAGDVKLPAQISLRIPQAGAPPYRVIYYLDNTDRPFLLDYRTYDEAPWSRIVFTTPAARIRIEYYDGGLDFSSVNRSYLFKWPGDMASDQLKIAVKQPAHAGSMVLPARFSEGKPGEDGLTTFTTDLGQVDAGSSFSFAIQYQKEGSVPSFTQQAVQAIEPISRDSVGRFDIQNILPGILGAILILVILVLFMIFGLRRISGTPELVEDRALADQQRKPIQPVNSALNAVYCQVCGNRAAAGDNFCRVCGSRIVN